MLTLVAAVLAYDRALDTVDCFSSRSTWRFAMSETREENDMADGRDLMETVVSCGICMAEEGGKPAEGCSFYSEFGGSCSATRICE